jgi:hypothetical protein
MQELFPVALGIVAGGLIGLLRPGLRVAVGAALAVVLGTLATIVTGEFRVSWEFVLFDIPLVAVCTVLTHILVRRMRHVDPGVTAPS